jgi:hypothetical protein
MTSSRSAHLAALASANAALSIVAELSSAGTDGREEPTVLTTETTATAWRPSGPAGR